MKFNAKLMAEQVLSWSNINSGSYNKSGLEKMAETLLAEFSILNCEQESIVLPPIEQPSLHAKTPQKIELGPLLRFWKRPDAPNQVLLVAHMDTVFPEEHSFQKAYFESDAVLRGPGVTDMKGGICVMLSALNAFEQYHNKDKLGWEVLINPDEEIGSVGSAHYLELRAKHHQVGLLYEPAMDEKGTFAGQRKGSGKFAVIAEGVSAHAGRNHHLGKNAITALAEAIVAIDNLNNKRVGVTLNIGQIEGGTAINVVPDTAMAKLDVRTVKKEDEHWLKTTIESILETVQKKKDVKLTLQGQFTRAPKTFDEKTQRLYEFTVNVAKKLGKDLTWQDSGGCSDGNNLSKVGLPNIDTLGVCGGKIHSEGEYLLVNSLAERAELSLQLLIGLCDY